jgi:hypothetical protein
VRAVAVALVMLFAAPAFGCTAKKGESYFTMSMACMLRTDDGVLHYSDIGWEGYTDECGVNHTTSFGYDCDSEPCFAEGMIASGWLPPWWEGLNAAKGKKK